MPQHYDSPKGDPHLGDESARDLQVLSQHISRWWGESPEVFHEIVSEYVHIDLHIIPAASDRPYHTVITTGMSDRPMTPPNGGPDHYCELLLALPPDWPVRTDDLHDERYWWPYRHLKQTARFPHVFETFLWYGHTLANEDPPQPFHATAPFSGGILSILVLCPKEAWSVPIREGKEVFFFSFLPLFERELRFAWKNSSEALFEQLDKINLTELIQPSRESVV